MTTHKIVIAILTTAVFCGTFGFFLGVAAATERHRQAEDDWQFETTWLCNYISGLTSEEDHAELFKGECLAHQIRKHGGRDDADS